MSEPAKVSREQIEKFRELLEILNSECRKLIDIKQELKAENNRLRKENARLTDQVAKKEASPVLSSKERMVLKQQLGSLIKRIDHHLEEPA